MDITLLLTLTGLALIDSTSIGTLFIPIWLLLAPGNIRARQILIYLAAIALFYFAVGVMLMLGAGPLMVALEGAMDNPVALWSQLVLGVGLFIVSFRFDSKRSRRLGKPDRAARWRERAASGTGTSSFLVTLAVIAALAEVATMLPYLAAMAILSTTDLSLPVMIGLLAAYCAVMVVPALLLLAARMVSDTHIRPLLLKFDAWISRHGETAVGWILGIVGFLVARDAFAKLSLPLFGGG